MATGLLSKTDIDLVADAIEQMELICVAAMVEAYEELTRLFAKERGRPISDRRLVVAMRVMKANVLLRNAHEVEWDDLDQTEMALVDNPADREKFRVILAKVKEQFQDESARDLGTSEISVVEALLEIAPNEDLSLVDDARLVSLRRELFRAKSNLVNCGVTTQVALQKRREAISEIDSRVKATSQKMDEVG